MLLTASSSNSIMGQRDKIQPNQRYGAVVTIRKSDNPHVTPKGKALPVWMCICDQGHEVEIAGYTLLARGDATKCPSCHKPRTASRKKPAYPIGHKRDAVEELAKSFSVGDKIKNLTVIKIDGSLITCRCDCGNIVSYYASALHKSRATSRGPATCGKNCPLKLTQSPTLSTSTNQATDDRRPIDNKSGYAGVHQASNKNSWFAVITYNNVTRYLGCWTDKDKAIAARLTAEEQLKITAQKDGKR